MKRAVRSGWFGVPAGAGVSATQTPQLRWERSAAKRSVPAARWQERSTPTFRRVPSSRSGQLHTAGRVSNGRGTNVKPRPPDWTEDEGPASTPSLRPALPAESNLKSAAAAFPRRRPWGERIIPRVEPRATGTMPPGFYGGKHWKSQTTQPLSPARNQGGIPCEGNRPDRSIEFIETSTKVHKTRPAICRASRAPTSTTAPT